jgi:hypothetical protein
LKILDCSIRSKLFFQYQRNRSIRSKLFFLIRDDFGEAAKLVVTLAGWVDSYLKKLAAEEAAHRVHGVKAVVNDLEVRLPGYAERTDADLAAAVVSALKWDAKTEIPVLLRPSTCWGLQERTATMF